MGDADAGAPVDPSVSVAVPASVAVPVAAAASPVADAVEALSIEEDTNESSKLMVEVAMESVPVAVIVLSLSSAVLVGASLLDNEEAVGIAFDAVPTLSSVLVLVASAEVGVAEASVEIGVWDCVVASSGR